MLSTRSPLMIVVLLFCSTLLSAQTKKKVTIKHATVFLNGAELQSTAKVNLSSGETEILFTNIAGNVNQQSLNVGTTNGVIVQSAVFKNNYLTDDNNTERAQEITDSIEYLKKKQILLNTDRSVVDEQISLLNQNRQVYGTKNGLSIEELQKMLALVKEQMMQLLKERSAIDKKVYKIGQRITKLQRQLQEEKQKGTQPGGQLLVKFYSTRTTTSDITISYVIPNAGWAPSYDIRVDDLHNPLQLAYKAHVYQNSGVSWDKVKLTLSTGNPNEGAQAPALYAWYLNYYRPTPVTYSANTATNQSLAPPAVSPDKAGAQRVITSEQIAKLPTRNTTSMASTTIGNTYQAADDGGISIGGGRGSGTLYYVDGIQVAGSRGVGTRNKTPKSNAYSKSTVTNYTQVSNIGVNSRFDIDLEYTIPSDGKTYIVAIKKHQLKATFKHFAVPKLDDDAFLQAHVTDWDGLGLLPGPTSIYYGDAYVGQGYMDMRGVKDTMKISLGRDKKVIVRRERDKSLRSTRTIGSNVRESFAYTISVRNTRNEPIDISIMDQLPISTDKSIDVEDRNYKGADYDDKKGELTWELSINPNTTQKVQMSFTVKYPKGKPVYL